MTHDVLHFLNNPPQAVYWAVYGALVAAWLIWVVARTRRSDDWSTATDDPGWVMVLPPDIQVFGSAAGGSIETRVSWRARWEFPAAPRCSR